jgi:hypothetical protein
MKHLTKLELALHQFMLHWACLWYERTSNYNKV